MNKIFLVIFLFPLNVYANTACSKPPQDARKYAELAQEAAQKGDINAACIYSKRMLTYFVGFNGCTNEINAGVESLRKSSQEFCESSEKINNSKNSIDKFSKDANCPGYLAAKNKCATAGNYDKCMNIIFPAFPYSYSDLELCELIK